MSTNNEYENWRKHFLVLAKTEMPAKQRVYVVNDQSSQSGDGIKMISLSQHRDQSAAGVVNKRKRKSKKPQSTSKRRIETLSW